mmetsp:Transcript_6943/g.12014  ORF Transcript_6943/g.12014 Transcript_6943/m.12014 type:complete len:461 (-) Transcript_6943:372-1754(-)|eukprot:CAMPEP_0198197810 /NCGR_PEP_ID=MMETSP1445-20131203/1374_1 /TAXON_ID=36898 /ORGANISM="Pyramimonas sp., Strain CCMP2087" /LENGTH=460 /DNA_ID=CAMNT_0043867205 /DNA_START=106 /DNA_END=1488 /DNA_ORIENTATION=+
MTSSQEDELAELRSSFAFAQVCHFCRVFAVALRIKSLQADHLEQCILHPAANNKLTSELIYKLVRPDATRTYSEYEAESKWHEMLLHKVRSEYADFWEADPLFEGDYYAITPLQRVNIILALCEWRLNQCQEVRDSISASVNSTEFTADCLRQEPLGADGEGRLYFHFASDGEDCRLYRETSAIVSGGKLPKLKSDAQWETVCVTLEDVEELIARLRKGKKADKALGKSLENDVLKPLEETRAARERQLKRALEMEAMPRKRSSRIASVMSSQNEEEVQRRLEAEQQAELEKQLRAEAKILRLQAAREARAAVRDAALWEAAQKREEEQRRRDELTEYMESQREERWSKRFHPDGSENLEYDSRREEEEYEQDNVSPDSNEAVDHGEDCNGDEDDDDDEGDASPSAPMEHDARSTQPEPAGAEVNGDPVLTPNRKFVIRIKLNQNEASNNGARVSVKPEA